jgi:uncharacterized protein (TIGR02594 family)
MPRPELWVSIFGDFDSPVFPKVEPKAERSPPWLIQATKLVGTAGVPGRSHSPIIMGWASRLKHRLGMGYPADEIPWCGLFAAYVLAISLPEEKIPSNPLRARNWLHFGKPIPEPIPGAILIFTRGRSQETGHVGFCAGVTRSEYRVLGGNQANAVNIMSIPRTSKEYVLLGCRWPTTHEAPK